MAIETVQSVDGTTIAFDRLGAGPPIVLVRGAPVDRHVGDGYAAGLAEHFTVLSYDRGDGDPGAHNEVLAGQDHAVTPEAPVPVVAAFARQFAAGP